jgi:hypothetical protein
VGEVCGDDRSGSKILLRKQKSAIKIYPNRLLRIHRTLCKGHTTHCVEKGIEGLAKKTDVLDPGINHEGILNQLDLNSEVFNRGYSRIVISNRIYSEF